MSTGRSSPRAVDTKWSTIRSSQAESLFALAATMDFSYLERLAKQASEISLYDIKTVVNKAKNVVLNLSEIEGKVREATNDDAWGASSTVMMEIAQAYVPPDPCLADPPARSTCTPRPRTCAAARLDRHRGPVHRAPLTSDSQLFNEIMPTIYQRFTEKEARQWRQIYKALVLLEFLVKNGSERVIDDARSHLSLIKVLRNFHYTDEGGKDQGINGATPRESIERADPDAVRNRSRELAELLADLDKVRVERRKAKANRNKYTGVGNDAGGGPSFQSEGSRYGGFGSDSFSENGTLASCARSSRLTSSQATAAGVEVEAEGPRPTTTRLHGATPASLRSTTRANGRKLDLSPHVARTRRRPPPPPTTAPRHPHRRRSPLPFRPSSTRR